jgi:hypothetical protein
MSFTSSWPSPGFESQMKTKLLMHNMLCLGQPVHTGPAPVRVCVAAAAATAAAADADADAGTE